jgi:serine protease Do
MIRKTLAHTKEAVFVVCVPDKNNLDYPTPCGTGFFISGNGYFLTAYHVVEGLDQNADLKLERPGEWETSALVLGVKVVRTWPAFDLALLKADFAENKARNGFKTRTDFPYLDIEFQDQEEGSPVYAYGYPLMESAVETAGNITVGMSVIPTRVTSAIIASTNEHFAPIQSSVDPKFYVIDKALNYGNSGGPIIMTESGKVISVCVRFQPQIMKETKVMVPSLYGISSSLKNIQSDLRDVLTP